MAQILVRSRMRAVIMAMMMAGAQAAITVEIAVALPLPANELVPEKLRQAVAIYSPSTVFSEFYIIIVQRH